MAALQHAWEVGDAVLPVDQRLPAPAKEELLRALRPTIVVTETGANRRPDGVPVIKGDALVVATSGTTGAPKGVILTYEAVKASALATSARLGVDAERDHWLACLPVAHIGGLSVVTRAILTHTPVTLLPGFDRALVDASDASLVSLVPAALRRIDASRWRVILLGGGTMPPASELPPNAVRTYGMTETGSGVVYDASPLDGVELGIVHGPDGNDIDSGDGVGPTSSRIRTTGEGQILVRGPMLLRAYRSGEPEGIDPKTADGWFATGDAGAIDSDGVLTVRGRIGDVIVTGGEKVWPDAVERVLKDATGVADIAVVGRPDPEWGEVVVAFVVPTQRSDPPSLDALKDEVRRVLPPYTVPRRLILLDEIPRTALGKVRRVDLRE